MTSLLFSFTLIMMIIISIALIKGILSLFKRVTVYEYERGLQYSHGKFRNVLLPGHHWIFSYTTTVTKFDIRQKFTSINGQEVISADGITLRVSMAARYEIADLNTCINGVENYQQALYLTLQMGLREIVASASVDELLENRVLFSQKLLEQTASQVKELGLILLSVNIKDMMFPGELKKIFAQTVKARREGQAALERARGETAALRHLANAAKMIENNPALMQLRLLQQFSESPGNTMVLGVPSTSIIPLKGDGNGKGEKRNTNSE
jgi:regulator of protease activity HflC (stomatin/prohibitin superfamily)